MTTRPVPASLRNRINSRGARRGLLVAFEGPPGSGKTTQCKLFRIWLEQAGHRVITVKADSARALKPILKTRQHIHALSPEELCLLHAAEFRHRLETQILPALWDGTTVLAESFLFTEIAKSSARGLDLDWLLFVHAPLFWPDLALYFSVTPHTSTSRVAGARVPKFYEAAQDVTNVDDPVASYRRFVARVIREYEAFATIFKFATVDGEQPIYEQHRQIRRLFGDGRQPRWGEWNTEAVAEWLARNPDVIERAHD
jgi:dTMP kinase